MGEGANQIMADPIMNDFNVCIDDLPLWSALFGQQRLDSMVCITIPFVVLDCRAM